MQTLPTDINAPRIGGKQAKLVLLLSRKSDVTLIKAGEALGWQKQTTSATLTGLRKRGYKIAREPCEGKDAVYRILKPAADT
jgi:hypothetical protein